MTAKIKQMRNDLIAMTMLAKNVLSVSIGADNDFTAYATLFSRVLAIFSLEYSR